MERRCDLYRQGVIAGSILEMVFVTLPIKAKYKCHSARRDVTNDKQASVDDPKCRRCSVTE